MELARPHPECTISQVEDGIRAYVGGRSAAEVQECYRTMAALTLQDKFRRALVVGAGEGDPHAHLAARDVVIAFDVIGVAAGFKIAFVPRSDATLNSYRHAEIEAEKRGLRAKVFRDEQEAVRWLTERELH